MFDEQHSKFDKMTIFQKAEFVQVMALFPALPAIVFLRRKVGFRTISPPRLFFVALVIIIAPLFVVHESYAPTVLYGFAFYGYGLFQRHSRWLDLCHDERWHTYSTGFTWLELIPFPAFLQNERRIYRFIDPSVFALLGGVVMLLGATALGSCMTISALSLMLWEMGDYDRSLNRVLDIHDGLLDAEVQQIVATHYSKKPGIGPLPLQATGGLPTGLGRDIAANIEARKRKQSATPLDASHGLAITVPNLSS